LPSQSRWSDRAATLASIAAARANEIGAVAGFEKSGHFFFNKPLGRGYDDGLIFALAVWDMLDRNPGKSMADLKNVLPKTWSSPTMSPHCADEVKFRYAGLVAKYWFEHLARLPVDIDVASEFRYREAPLTAGGLAIFVSQSGETADTLATLRYAKEHKQHVLAVVNVATSTIARESDVVMPTLAGPEIGVASTKAFTWIVDCVDGRRGELHCPPAAGTAWRVARWARACHGGVRKISRGEEASLTGLVDKVVTGL
jgi:hypothetical protein